MTEITNKVVTLLAEKGKKWEETKQCISSHDGSIVFLPREVSVGDIVRVELSPVTEKLDARGKVMYSAKLAPVVLSGTVRQLIAREALLLRGCEVFDQPTALALLRAKYGVALDAWKGYSHYFFEESGWVFASHFSHASLYLYEQVGSMQGAALTEPLLWALNRNFFTLREQGTELDWRSAIPQLTDEAVAKLVKKAEAGEPVLSTALVQIGGRVEIPGLTDALWRSATWPKLLVPDFESDISAVLPPVVSHEYGRDPNGEILKGYGVLVLSSGGSSTWQWHKDFVSATIAREESEAELHKFSEIWASKTQIKPQLEALQQRLASSGLSAVSFGSTRFQMGWESFDYSESSLNLILKKIEEKEAEVAKTAMEAAMRKAEAEKFESERLAAEAMESILQEQEKVRLLEKELALSWLEEERPKLTASHEALSTFAKEAAKAAKTPEGQIDLAAKLAELKKIGIGGKA